MQDAHVRLKQHENYGLRRKNWELKQSLIHTHTHTHPFNIFHNIFKPLWGCADMQQREKNLHSSQLVLFQKQSLNKGWSSGPMLSYK